MAAPIRFETEKNMPTKGSDSSREAVNPNAGHDRDPAKGVSAGRFCPTRASEDAPK
jgi:hypothetical protein